MVEKAEQIFRDFVIDGVPTSGRHEPRKSDIRIWGRWLEDNIKAGYTNGGLIFDTKANLNLSLGHDADASAWVVDDPTAANNGIYRKSGPSGTGSWTKIAELPYSVIYAQNAGTGTADAVEATSAVPISTSPHAQLISVPFTAANTAAMTLSINGEMPRPLVTNTGAAIPAGYITAGMSALVQIDSDGNYRLFSYGDASAIQAAVEARVADVEDAADRAEAAAAGVEYPVSYAPQSLTPEQQEQARENLGATEIGHALITAGSKEEAQEAIGVSTGPGLSGLTLSNNVSDEENDIDIAAGFCADATGTKTMRLPVGITKRLDASWAVGSGNGGLDDGSKEASKTYFVHLIRKDDDGTCDALFSTSPFNPVLPAGYSSRRRLGAVLTDSSGKIIPFLQVGYEFRFKLADPPTNALDASNTVPTLRTLSVPTGIKVRAITFTIGTATSAGHLQMRDPDLGPWSTSNPRFGVASRGTGVDVIGGEIMCITNAAGQIYTCDSGGSATLRLWTRGWHDFLDMNR